MPNQPKTVAHTVRVEDELWQAAAAEANRRGESLSEAIRRFLKRYIQSRKEST
jgi:predicted HicB family RNase H-like nuclease